jgi:hypothetical protein
MELLGRRKESTNVRSKLLLQSRERFAFFFDPYVLKTRKTVLDTQIPLVEAQLRKAPIIRVQLVPAFPLKPLAGVQNLRKKLKPVLAWRIGAGNTHQFPPYFTERTVQDAIIREGAATAFEIAEFNEFGLLSFSYSEWEDARRALHEPTGPAEAIDYLAARDSVLAMMCFGTLAYEALSFFGLCEFAFEITGLRGRRLALGWSGRGDIVGSLVRMIKYNSLCGLLLAN